MTGTYLVGSGLWQVDERVLALDSALLVAGPCAGLRVLSCLRLPVLQRRMAPLLLGLVGVPGWELAAAAGGYRGADLLAVLQLERGHLLAVGLVGLVAGGVLVHASEWQGLLAAETLLALFVDVRLGLA